MLCYLEVSGAPVAPRTARRSLSGGDALVVRARDGREVAGTVPSRVAKGLNGGVGAVHVARLLLQHVQEVQADVGRYEPRHAHKRAGELQSDETGDGAQYHRMGYPKSTVGKSRHEAWLALP